MRGEEERRVGGESFEGDERDRFEAGEVEGLEDKGGREEET